MGDRRSVCWRTGFGGGTAFTLGWIGSKTSSKPVSVEEGLSLLIASTLLRMTPATARGDVGGGGLILRNQKLLQNPSYL